MFVYLFAESDLKCYIRIRYKIRGSPWAVLVYPMGISRLFHPFRRAGRPFPTGGLRFPGSLGSSQLGVVTLSHPWVRGDRAVNVIVCKSSGKPEHLLLFSNHTVNICSCEILKMAPPTFSSQRSVWQTQFL